MQADGDVDNPAQHRLRVDAHLHSHGDDEIVFDTFLILKREIDTSSEPLLADFHKERRNQTQARGFIGENGDDPGAASNFPIEPFQHIGGANPATMFCRESEHGQAFRQVLFHPPG